MSGSKATALPPNTTLYVKNLRSTIKKPELRRQLYALFIVYGRILDVVATRAEGMRGQAFVVFENLAGSTAALRAMDGFSFYGQPLILDYAKASSKATIVHERGPEALFDPTLKFGTKKDTQIGKVTFSSAGADLQGRERKRAREEAGQRGEIVESDSEGEESDERADEEPEDDQRDVKRRKSEVNNSD
ncbi:hypothetical protein IEQ34_025192 [Dendrobium chrysotoxum]|jgi:RNA recognition motif-containing protein|uniref:RRM domain-containing protein n=1 Tax=Dendrobium chrysotoxum TaxID=161865 RepID=A0AAV7FQU9_DENCH|nr:hypothetical protein IEQ34_025192 [Dendrobium chrysotoxum]